MSVVALSSPKGSPGVTTLAVALASWWPRPSIVIEADPAGGDLAARLALPEEPGLVSLAAAHRRRPITASSKTTLLEPFVQETAAGIRAVVAPASPRQVVAALGLLPEVRPTLAPRGTDLLVDIGRMSEPGVGARGATNRIALAAASAEGGSGSLGLSSPTSPIWPRRCRTQRPAIRIRQSSWSETARTQVTRSPRPSVSPFSAACPLTRPVRLPYGPVRPSDGDAASSVEPPKTWPRPLSRRSIRVKKPMRTEPDGLGASRPEAPDQGHATVPTGGGR